MNKATLLVALFLLVLPFSSVQGQVAAAQVEISCSPEEISVDVYPGTTVIQAMLSAQYLILILKMRR